MRALVLAVRFTCPIATLGTKTHKLTAATKNVDLIIYSLHFDFMLLYCDPHWAANKIESVRSFEVFHTFRLDFPKAFLYCRQLLKFQSGTWLAKVLPSYSVAKSWYRKRLETISKMQYKSIEPFIPSGKDYDLARRFFAEIGFTEHWENNGMAGFGCGTCSFLLQRYDNEAFAQNLMMKLIVPDLDSWWTSIQAKSLETMFPSVKFKPPTRFPWGTEVNFIDTAGVCWHVSEK